MRGANLFSKLSTRCCAALLILALVGCAGPSHFISPDADLPYYERVAVIPFTTMSQDRLAGERVASVFMTEILNRRVADVVDPGQFAAAMMQTRGGTPFASPWSTADLAKLGKLAGVQGIFLGTVREYEMARSGRDAFPLISLEVHLVDATTGQIVWSADQTRKGGPSFPLFGWTEIHTLGELSSVVCGDMLETLK